MSVNVYAQNVLCRQVDAVSPKRRPAAIANVLHGRTITFFRLPQLVLLLLQLSPTCDGPPPSPFLSPSLPFPSLPFPFPAFVRVTTVLLRGVQFTVVRPGGLTVDPPTGTINVIKGEVSLSRLTRCVYSRTFVANGASELPAIVQSTKYSGSLCPPFSPKLSRPSLTRV